MTVTSALPDIADYCAQRGLIAHAGLVAAHRSTDRSLAELMYRPVDDDTAPPSIGWAVNTAAASAWPMPDNLVPLLPVDDESFACVVNATADRPDLRGAGSVVRWHLGITSEDQQATLLDTAPDIYAESVAEELRFRPAGLTRMFDEIGPAYQLNYLDQAKRPKGYEVRPVRIACQNVIVGLAAFAQDSGIDGMSVVAWQTCEVPHVATHEGNRALAALMLCDAFQRGGTMEIRFDRPARLVAKGRNRNGDDVDIDAQYPGHPEMRVPASLRRFGRTIGVGVGAEDPAAVSPAEARELFLAVTRMPDDLRRRVDQAVGRGLTSAERLCYTLLAPVWRDIELDFLLATTNRTGSIVSGGANWWDRSARQAESEVCRAAVMVDMLYRRLNASDLATTDGTTRLVEDRKIGVTWRVDPNTAAVKLSGLTVGDPMPWASASTRITAPTLTVYPRSMLSTESVEAAINSSHREPTAIVIPAGVPIPDVPDPLLVLRCPDRLADIDSRIAAKLRSGRLSSE